MPCSVLGLHMHLIQSPLCCCNLAGAISQSYHIIYNPIIWENITLLLQFIKANTTLLPSLIQAYIIPLLTLIHTNIPLLLKLMKANITLLLYLIHNNTPPAPANLVYYCPPDLPTKQINHPLAPANRQ